NQALTNVTVATFSDSYIGQVASDLQVTIDWGDGSTVDTGTLSGSAGSFTVTGSHTYTADGQYNINVGVLDEIANPEGETPPSRGGQSGRRHHQAHHRLATGRFPAAARPRGKQPQPQRRDLQRRKFDRHRGRLHRQRRLGRRHDNVRDHLGRERGVHG